MRNRFDHVAKCIGEKALGSVGLTVTQDGHAEWKQLARETRDWQQTADLMAAFFALRPEGGRV